MTGANGKPNSAGMLSLTPHIICADALQAIDFYKQAFGATEAIRLLSPDGKLVHASLGIGPATLMLAEENPAWGTLGPKALNGTSTTLHLATENVDAAIERAVAAGAKLIMPATDMFWGDRYGQVEDPFGHRWSLATHIRDMNQEEMQKAMDCAMPQ